MLSPKKEKRYLSEAIDYDRDIEPYQFIKIYAGVGSGKNTLIDNLVKGDGIEHKSNPSEKKYVERKNVLLISSRRAKVDEQLEQEGVAYDPVILSNIFIPYWLLENPKYENKHDARIVELPDLSGWGKSRVYEQSAVLTNAGVEHSIMKQYLPNEAASQPWLRFDMIVIDEVHSLLADASYQSAPFYVRRLIEKTLEANKACKVIVMTGSPQILDGIPLFENAHMLNMMEQCENVVPESICFITAKEAMTKQKAMLQKGKKFVAFFNHIRTMKKLFDEMPDKVVMSFSDAEQLSKLKNTNEQAYNRMDQVKRSLAVEQRLPEDILAFLTTSRNKEGINIKNEDIEAMFVEAHVDIDVVQMAGRIRHGVKTLYVIVDSAQYPDKESRFEAELSQRTDMLEAINTKFREICEATDYDFDEQERFIPVLKDKNRKEFIEYIHEKYPYIRFDYFTDQFVYYPERKLSKSYYAKQSLRFERATEEPGGLLKLAQEWYPGIKCTVSRKAKSLCDRQKIIEDYLRKKGYENGKRIDGSERTNILDEINVLLGEEAKSLGALLKRNGYEVMTCSKSKKTDTDFVIVKTDE